MTLKDAINERVSFLKEQTNPKNVLALNRTFQIQIDTLRSTDTEKVANVILRKKVLLERSVDVAETERLFTEQESLEWLQRQVVKHPA